MEDEILYILFDLLYEKERGDIRPYLRSCVRTGTLPWRLIRVLRQAAPEDAVVARVHASGELGAEDVEPLARAWEAHCWSPA